MRRARARAAPLSGEGGWTLIEMLVASTIAFFVIGAGVKVLTSTLNAQPQAASRASGVQQARFTVERLTRELRQGSAVSTATTSQLSLVTYVDQATCGGAAATSSRLCQVTYTCSAGACTRAVANPGSSGGTAVEVVSGLSSSNVFTYSPSSAAPTFVGVTLAFPSRSGSNAITLSDGVALRNTGSTG